MADLTFKFECLASAVRLSFHQKAQEIAEIDQQTKQARLISFVGTNPDGLGLVADQ